MRETRHSIYTVRTFDLRSPALEVKQREKERILWALLRVRKIHCVFHTSIEVLHLIASSVKIFSAHLRETKERVCHCVWLPFVWNNILSKGQYELRFSSQGRAENDFLNISEILLRIVELNRTRSSLPSHELKLWHSQHWNLCLAL